MNIDMKDEDKVEKYKPSKSEIEHFRLFNQSRMTQSSAKHLFRYCTESGQLFWKESARGRSISKPVGGKGAGGYLRVTVTTGRNKKSYRLHKIVWLVASEEYGGIYSEVDVVHLDGNKLNNRVENLSEM